MHDTPSFDRAGLEIMTRLDCLRALTTPGVGALTVTRAAMPLSLPVGYTLHSDAINETRLVIRARSDSVVARTQQEVVAFCAFAADPEYRSGWSVSVTGFARRVDDESLRIELAELPLLSWNDGRNVSQVFLCVSLEHMSGRVFHSDH